MKTAKSKNKPSKVETQYCKTTTVNGVVRLKMLQYVTAKLTPMHEHIRNYYPAETRIGQVVTIGGCFSMFVIEKRIASKDWEWAFVQAVKQYRADKRLTA